MLEARPHGRDPSELLDTTLRGGVDVVQLRDKELPAEDLVRAAEPFRRLCDAHGALFVLNDRPELVKRCDADGVHVGQGDAPVSEGIDRSAERSRRSSERESSVPAGGAFVRSKGTPSARTNAAATAAGTQVRGGGAGRTRREDRAGGTAAFASARAKSS